MEQESVNYWISVGERRAKKRIIKLLEKLFEAAENAETRRLLWTSIAEVKGEK